MERRANCSRELCYAPCDCGPPCTVCSCWDPCVPYTPCTSPAQFSVQNRAEMPISPTKPETPTQSTLLPPCESFYVLVRDALQERLPSCVRNYRRHFDVNHARQRHLTAEKKHEELLTQRRQNLTRNLRQAELKNVTLFVQRNLKRCQAKRRLASDMTAHVQRRIVNLILRTEILRAHHAIVQSRSELLRYGNYLRWIAETYEEKRKRRSIF